MATGTCALCNKDSHLLMSHIIPRFVFKLLQTQSKLRSGNLPNKRIQDSTKSLLLCSSCEALLSKWEGSAYQELFLPLNDTSAVTTRIPYARWALKFAVSVSWRVLIHHFKQYGLQYLTDKQQAQANEALKTWRSFLLGELPNPGQFEQHLLPLDLIEKHGLSDISPFMNRYIMTTYGMAILHSQRSVTTCAKMGRIFLFGLVQSYEPNRWKRTKLHVNSGAIIIPTTYCFPTEILDFMNEQANKAAAHLASVSDKQRTKIREAILDDIDKFADSDIFRAMERDVIFSGREAFRVTESPKHN